MAFPMNTQFLTRQFSPVYRVVLPAATLLGAVATYGPRIFAGPAIQVGPQEIGAFAFHKGVLLPHQEYLYGSSETGEPFIVGKKLAGKDYSAWEAGYGRFARLESLTFTNSGSQSTWSWSFEAPKASTSLTLLQLLLWLLFASVCVLLLCYATYKIVKSLSDMKIDNNDKEILASPTDDIDAEHSKLDSLWRSALISMCRERKSEILSLSKLLAAQQRELDSLRQMLDTQTTRAQDSDSYNRRIEAENNTCKETIKDLEEQIKALNSGKEGPRKTAEDLDGRSEAVWSENKADSDDAEQPLGLSQPEFGGMPKEAVAGNQGAVADPPMGSSEDEHGMAETTVLGDENVQSATEQDDSTPAPDNQTAGPKLGKNGKPLIPRANRRGDGSIRTPSHPDYVPLEEAPSPLGDRPFRGRGNGWNKGHGGGGGAYFGWRGGRGRRGGGGNGGGANKHHGQYVQGRGQ